MTIHDVSYTLLNGWSLNEKHAKWSIGPESSVEINCDSVLQQGGYAWVTIYFDIYIPRSRSGRRVSFGSAGIQLTSKQCYSRTGQRATIQIPENNILEGRIAIDINLEAVESPKEAGESEDIRRLGIQITNVTLDDADNHYSRKKILAMAGKLASEVIAGDRLNVDPWNNILDLANLIEERVNSRTPFALVRVGDGEGRLLGYPHFFSRAEVIRECITYQYGTAAVEELNRSCVPDAIDSGVRQLCSLIRQSLTNADAVGIPMPIHFDIGADPDKVNGIAGFASAVLSAVASCPHIDQHHIFDTYIFPEMYRRGLLVDALRAASHISLISHTDLRAQLAPQFGVRDMAFYKIPGHQTFMASDEAQFPVFWKTIVSRIVVPFQGSVFLVGAGYLGKVYCDVIKQRGGIALDVGSLFDGWSGLGRVDPNEHQSLRL
jgi:hypothetical protein